MATTGRTLSPGGALLRGSRMFSLPAAITTPASDFSAATSYRSETATQIFPTLQSVTSPDKFRQRGDWGFKRHFPLKSTARTSTPALRIKQVDSVEHVTDYSSAADHSLTLEKFDEMNVVITYPPPDNAGIDTVIRKAPETKESVFEDDFDFTALDDKKIATAGQQRWKYRSPWLANLSEGTFQTFLKKRVRGRRTEFRQFLRVQLAARETRQAEARAMAKGNGDKVLPPVRPEDITEEQLAAYLRDTREQERDSLFDYVSKFLDLPPCKIKKTTDYVGQPPGETRTYTSHEPYASSGPPATHPSAGLSYMRSSSYLENHPVYGPQSQHRPVKARMMLTQGAPYIGVGGFVVSADVAKKMFKTAGNSTDYTVPGGPKTWVDVRSAHISSTGRAILHSDEASVNARMIQEEAQGERRLYHDQSEEAATAHQEIWGPKSTKTMHKKDRSSPWRVGRELGQSSGYGVSVPARPSSMSPESEDY